MSYLLNCLLILEFFVVCTFARLGYVYPKTDLFLKPYGNTTIQCFIFQEHVKKGCQTEGTPHLLFKFKGQVLPTHQRKNDTTISIILKNVTKEQSGQYQCYCQRPSGDIKEIDNIQVHVGCFPEIENAHCVSYNFEKLVCSWRLNGSLPVSVNAFVQVQNHRNKARLECVTRASKNQEACEVARGPLIMYKTMTLLLEAFAGGQLRSQKVQVINQYQIAVPGDNYEVSAKPGPGSVKLTVVPNKGLRFSFLPNMVYQIEYIDPSTKTKVVKSNIVVEYTDDGEWAGNVVNVTNLQDDTSYNFTVRNRLLTADEDNPQLWHTEFKMVKTLPTEITAVRGPRSMMLHWTPRKQFRLLKPIDLVYEIQYVDPWTNNTKVISNIFVSYTSDGQWEGNLASITDLEEDTSYSFTIKGRLREADEDNSQSWTTELTTFRTLPTVPETPEVPPGLFLSHNIAESGTRDVLIYWKDLLPYQWNGPEHVYRVQLGEGVGRATKANKMEYIDVEAEEELRFNLVAKNKKGSSREATIVIPATSNLLQAPKAKKEYIGNENFRIIWQPTDNNNATSYTIAWCKDPNIISADCNGSFNWEEVDGSSVSVDVHRGDFYHSSVNHADVPFAIAVNSASSSSGLIAIEK